MGIVLYSTFRSRINDTNSVKLFCPYERLSHTFVEVCLFFNHVHNKTTLTILEWTLLPKLSIDCVYQ